MTLTPARALIGALTPEEARAIASPDSWPWPMSQDAQRWADNCRAYEQMKRDSALTPAQQEDFDRHAHDDFMKRFL